MLQFLTPRRLQRLEAVMPASPLSQSDALVTLVALMPLQYGDLAVLGLAGWWMLGLINASTGLPWFHTIIARTLFSRLLSLAQLYRARMAQITPDRAQQGARSDVLDDDDMM